MLQSVRELLLPAAQRRLVLLANHVLSREPAAVERLRPHAGRVVRLEVTHQPAWAPALPPLVLVVTPAGLCDLADAAQGEAPDLRLGLSAEQPALWLAAAAGGTRPAAEIEGDAALAADVSWLFDNLRWDVEADVAALIGPVAAHLVAEAGRTVAAALRRVLPAAGAPTR
jgi:ubiquinone biosynthesis protein UbiJ